MREKCSQNERELVKDFVNNECVVLAKEDPVFPNRVEKLNDLFDMYMDWRVEVLEEVDDRRFYKDSIGMRMFSKILAEKGYTSDTYRSVTYKGKVMTKSVYEKCSKKRKVSEKKVVEKKDEKQVHVDRNVPSIYMYNKYLEKGYLPKRKLKHFVEMYDYLKNLDDNRLSKNSMVYLGPIKQWKRLASQYLEKLSNLGCLPALDIFDGLLRGQEVTRGEYEDFLECLEEYERLEKEGYVDERWAMEGEEYLERIRSMVK